MYDSCFKGVKVRLLCYLCKKIKQLTFSIVKIFIHTKISGI